MAQPSSVEFAPHPRAPPAKTRTRSHPRLHPSEATLDNFDIGHVILGRYEVTDILGTGGMGCVMAARDLELNRPVAIKFLLPSLRDRPEIVSRFEREARTCVRLRNEHVVDVLTVEKVNGVPFMVMEYLRGHDLGSVIRRNGALPLAESVDLLLQACEAIAEAHSLGIVHRDLKPANLFVTTGSNGRPLIKVIDFGIAKSTSADDLVSTAHTVAMGSPVYMSTEQFASASDVDERSDVWSLGVTLYEMLSGTPPFSGDSVQDVYAAIRRGKYSPLSERRPDIPAPIEQVLSEALAIDRDERLPSVKSFAAKLASFGTHRARASYACIEDIAACEPGVADDFGESLPLLRPAHVMTEDMQAGRRRTTVTGVVGSLVDVARTHKRWVPLFGLLAVAALASSIVVLRVAHRSLPAPAPASSTSPSASKVTECTGGATAACEAACAKQQPGACHELARALETGVGAPRDYARAATLYQADCAGGAMNSCNRLGALYAQGDGVARDAAKAVELYKRACDAGFAAACVNLGTMHFDGQGVPKNESLGARLFLRGCEAGELLGCVNVSVAYAQGRGVPKDTGRAFAFADRACKGGELLGCVRMAAARITGEGAPKDVQGGLTQLDALCTQGAVSGCEILAGMYVKGLGADVPADPLRVREYEKKVCDLGATRDCGDDKVLRTADSMDTVSAQENALLQKHCDAGELVSCGLLGENLTMGIGASVDRVRGKGLLEKACKGGVDRACKKLAEQAAGSRPAQPTADGSPANVGR